MLGNVVSSHLDVATLQGQTKTCLLIFDKVQRHLRVSLLLQVGNYGLTHQFGITHHVENLENHSKNKLQHKF